MRIRKRLGDLLVEREVITEDQLLSALREQKDSKLKLGDQLVKNGHLSQKLLYGILEDQYGIPYVDLNRIVIDPKVPKLISETLAIKHTVIPIALDNAVLTVAMADPLDVIALDDIRISTEFQIIAAIAPAGDIEKLIRQYYDVTQTAEQAVREYSLQKHIEEEEKEVEDADVTNSPMVRLVNSIISRAIRMKASDIHIEPFENHVRIRFRIDGQLHEIMKPAKATHSGMITRIKIMSALNISEKRLPQDGRVETNINGFIIDMRISILPTVHGEKVVIRLLDRSTLALSKEDIGFTEHNLKTFNKVISIPEGIILMTGPTGSGKTTTLYSVLKEMNKIDRNIITVEDPVEYRLPGVNQVQVNNKAGLTFANGLRSILRQDPDIVMIGEIRDSETASIAVRAAITGHVVLSTVHTNDTASTIDRLVDMGVEKYLVASAIKGIIAQRLVRVICSACKVEYEIDDSEREILNLPETHLHKGEGCNACNHSGYSGRVAIHEILPIDSATRRMIMDNVNTDLIKKYARENGMMTLHENCQDLVMKGITTIDEMRRVTYSIDQD